MKNQKDLSKKSLLMIAALCMVSVAAMPLAAADISQDPNDCVNEADQQMCTAYQGGNCNNYGDASVNFWTQNDCSSEQYVYYCNTAAGSGQASVGVTAGGGTEGGDTSGGASAGGGCDQGDGDDDSDR